VLFLHEQGFTIRSTSRSGMGTALLQFPNSLSLELAVNRSPFSLETLSYALFHTIED
jgi:hypothetical protein